MKWIGIAFLLLPWLAQAAIFEKCGTYEGGGMLLDRGQGNYSLFLDKRSESEIEVRFKSKIKRLEFASGANIRAKFLVERKCTFVCEAEKVELLEVLEPYEKAKQFQVIGFKPVKEQRCKK